MDPVFRIVFVYLLLMVLFRLMGKRELSEMSPFELVTLLLIPEIFSAALARDDTTLTHATIAVATLLALVFVTSVLTYRFPKLERVVEGEPTVLVRHGRFLRDNLARERVTADEVLAEMHKAGIEEVGEVRWAILEVDGKIAIIKRDPDRDVIQHDEGHKAG
jgi:uncharacterized membrane protein YcaP (DUF421 family)